MSFDFYSLAAGIDMIISNNDSSAVQNYSAALAMFKPVKTATVNNNNCAADFFKNLVCSKFL